MNWDAMSLEARNRAYNNVEHVGPDFARQKTEAWADRSAKLRQVHGAHLDLPYASGPRTKWDIYPAANPDAPCFVHIHGGYWQRGSKEIFACMAEGLQAHGWSAALPGYTLAPEASLSQIIEELHKAFDWLAKSAATHGVRGPIIVTGWSAGGHMTAMMLGHPAIKAGLSISGVFDLAHLRDSPHVNDKVQITEREVETLSPMRLPMARKVLTIAHGAAELPAMIDTSRDYHRRRSDAQLAGDLVPIPAANHFTILDHLLDSESHLVKAILALA